MARPEGRGGGFEFTTGYERILNHVAQNPAATVGETARALQIAPSTVSDNLRWLEKEGYVIGEELSERGRSYFAQVPPKERKFLILLATDEAWSILQHVSVRARPENQIEIGSRLNLNRNTVRKYAEFFVDAGIFDRVPVPVTPGAVGSPGVGYETRWKAIRPLLGLLLATLPPKSTQAARLATLLSLQPKPDASKASS